MRIEHYPGVADIIRFDDPVREERVRYHDQADRRYARRVAMLLVLAILSFIGWYIAGAYMR